VIHRIQQLILVGIIAEAKINKAEEKHQIPSWEDAVHRAQNKNKNSRWQIEAVLEKRWLKEFCKISRGFRCYTHYRIEKDTSKFKKSKRQKSHALQKDEVRVEYSKSLDFGGQCVCNLSGVFNRVL